MRRSSSERLTGNHVNSRPHSRIPAVSVVFR